MLGVRHQLLEFSKQTQELFSELGKIDWREIDQRLARDTVRLAELGWTVAPWMTPKEVSELAVLDSEALDQEFSKLYFEDGGLDRAKSQLTASARMADWQPLLAQVFGAIERKDHLITIPALLLMLEGFVAQFADPANSKLVCTVNVPNLVAAIQSTPDPAGITAKVWMSTTAFLDQLYKKSPFSDPSPSFVNRHWILHGRLKSTEWDVVDAIRLLNALSTLHWLMSFDER